MYCTLTSYRTIMMTNDGHYILNEYGTSSCWEKNSHTIDYDKIDMKMCSKQVVQQQSHITFKDILHNILISEG